MTSSRRREPAAPAAPHREPTGGQSQREPAGTGRRLTACVITLNEEERLAECLASLGFCDEIVVVDSGSTDGTREIAARFGATVIENPWPGFAAQRNVAIGRATGDWILEVDADERISPELARSIRQFLRDPQTDVAALPLRNRFLGRWLGPSARYPAYRVRLFRNGALRHDEGRHVHEGLWGVGAITPLDGDLLHIKASSWREALDDTRRYARLEAAHIDHAPSATEALLGIVVRPAAKLLYRSILRGGARDGPAGIANIALEVGGDALVWIHAARAGRHDAGRGERGPRGHFSHTRPAGPVRIVGLATTAEGSSAAAEWLARAAAVGGWATLVSPHAPQVAGVRSHRIASGGARGILRAVRRERLLAPVDAYLPADARAGVLARLLRPALGAPTIRLDADPDVVLPAFRGERRD